jgi:hypothetical protein
MNELTLQRLAPLSGVLFLILAVAAFALLGETPMSDDSTAEVLDFWKDNEDEAQFSALLTALAAISLAWFGGVLRVALRKGDPDPGRLSAVAFGGALVAATGIALFAGIAFALGDTVGDVPPEVTQTLSVMNSDMFFPTAVGVVLMLLATGLVIVRSDVLPRWLGWVSIVLGVVGMTPAGFFAFLATLVWVAGLGVMLYLREGGTPAGGAATPPRGAGPASP